MLKISFLLCEINSKTLLFLFLKVLFKKLVLQIPSTLNENVSLGFEFSLSDFFLSSILDLCYIFPAPIHTLATSDGAVPPSFSSLRSIVPSARQPRLPDCWRISP